MKGEHGEYTVHILVLKKNKKSLIEQCISKRECKKACDIVRTKQSKNKDYISRVSCEVRKSKVQ